MDTQGWTEEQALYEQAMYEKEMMEHQLESVLDSYTRLMGVAATREKLAEWFLTQQLN